MSASACSLCRQPKGIHTCGLCHTSVCKRCADVLPEDAFRYGHARTEALRHKNYCRACFSEHVAPALAVYEETLIRAKAVLVFTKGKGEETRLMNRSEKPLKIANCVDEREAVLKLAFLAAEKKYNCLLDVEIRGTKVRNEGYQTSTWSGHGIPTKVDVEKVERRELQRRS